MQDKPASIHVQGWFKSQTRVWRQPGQLKLENVAQWSCPWGQFHHCIWLKFDIFVAWKHWCSCKSSQQVGGYWSGERNTLVSLQDCSAELSCQTWLLPLSPWTGKSRRIRGCESKLWTKNEGRGNRYAGKQLLAWLDLLYILQTIFCS